MLRDDQDIDDEISILYMQKDINQFWQKWNSKFSSKQCTPSLINGISVIGKLLTFSVIVSLVLTSTRTRMIHCWLIFWERFIVNFPQSPSLNASRAIHYLILLILKKS